MEREFGHPMAELEAAVLKAMAHDPDDRYQGVQDFQVDLEAYLDGRRVQAASYNPAQLLWKWLVRHKAVTIAAGAVLSLLLVWIRVVPARKSGIELNT